MYPVQSKAPHDDDIIIKLRANEECCALGSQFTIRIDRDSGDAAQLPPGFDHTIDLLSQLLGQIVLLVREDDSIARHC